MLNSILPKEVRDLLKGSNKWVLMLLGIAGLSALVEAVTLANLLFLGYAVLGQEATGALGDLIGGRVLGGYSQRGLLILLGSTFVVLVSLRMALTLAYRYLTYRWSSMASRKMYKTILGRILSAPIHIFDESHLGEILHALMNSPAGAISAVDSTTALISSVFLICSIAVMLALISPWLLLIAAVIAFLWFVALVPPLRKRLIHHQQQSYDQRAEGMKIGSDTINGIREIRALASEHRWSTEFSHTVDQWEDTRGRIVILSSLPPPVLQAMLQAGFGGAVVIAAIMLSADDLITQLPVLGAFAYGLFRAYPVGGQISQAWIGIGQALPNLRAAAVWTGLEEDPLAGGTEQVRHPIDVIRFDRLSFSYDSKEPTIIDADFRIQAGKVTALVGASGAGKSTLVDLMLKFRTPSQGVLWVGDQKLNDIVRRSWLDRVGLVRQDVFLFVGTIKDNLLEFKPDATDEELRIACRRAGALEFIDAMPYGLDTRIGERGVTLSGGQRQRIAIARALLRDSDILILDEAMSALDGETEAKILKSLLVDSPIRIIVLISHRLTTVRYADHIVVLDQGRVVEQGTHEELLEKQGRYWELFSTQVRQEPAVLYDVTSD